MKKSFAPLSFGEKIALKDISINIEPGQKIAIIGPTASGKTQLMNLLIGLILPTSGEIKYDKHDISEFKRESLYKQIGLVFQDSAIFNISLKDNIAFNTSVSKEDLDMAIQTSELSDLIKKFVLEELDHKNLNLDVKFLKGQMCSTENLAIAIWQQLFSQLPKNVQLHSVKLYETPRIFVEYFGN